MLSKGVFEKRFSFLQADVDIVVVFFVLENQLNLPHLIPQSAIFGFIDTSNEDYLIANYLLLLLKYFIYNAKDRKHLTFET